jgi:pentatricopeptide repeat protein
LRKEVALGTALVDMYAKCGMLSKAHKAFDMLPVQNAASWTALMTAYAQSGKAWRVLGLFNRLVSGGITPDMVTILAVLTACNHAGLVEEGRMIFGAMERSCCLDVSIEHYSCMVDLFSRAGHFDKALDVIEKVPPHLNRLRLWLSLLGACCKWANVELGRWAFMRLESLDAACDIAYVYMANVYAAAGMQAEADENR